MGYRNVMSTSAPKADPRNDDALCVEVRDEGRGGADPSKGSGLLGLRDRVEAIGGTMRLTSPPGAGTSLRVELPLRDQLAR